MSLPIVRYNNPLLRKKGEKITVFDAALTALMHDMLATMVENKGIGLAAQQVGRPLQLCVVDLRESDAKFDWNLDGGHPPRELFMPFAVINPQITVLPGSEEEVYEEGCLSFPKIYGDVIRPDAIEVQYQDQFGIGHTLRCNGLLARCIQHEADHLNGTLFIDRMAKKARQKIELEIKELARRTREEDAAKSPAK